VTEAQGIPLSSFTDSASVPEVQLLEPTLTSIPDSIRLPERMPLIADRAYDSDPLRQTLAEQGIDLIAPHRKNRKKAPTNDGRKLRRYRRRWKIERTFAWLHSYQRTVTRFEKSIKRFDGFVSLACAFIALNRLL
jgi:transposase